MPLDTKPIDALRRAILSAVHEEAQDTILRPAQSYIPVDTGTALHSGTLVVDGTDTYVSFGSDTDLNPKSGQPSNTYIVYVHENMEAHHDHGQAQFLLRAVNEATPNLVAGIARRVRFQ